MSTSVEIPEDLLDRALRTFPVQSPKELVIKALEEYAERHSQKHLIPLLGTFEDFITPEELDEMRKAE